MATKKFLDFCKEQLEEQEIRFCSCDGKAEWELNEEKKVF